MRILLLDNIDSFTFNIFHYLEALNADVVVKNNVSVQPSDLHPIDALVLSPGPGLPSTAGKLMEILGLAIEQRIPVLGVCLGMQAIAEHFGGSLFNQQEVKHGQQERISHISASRLFTGIPQQFNVGLYHSWGVSEPLPDELIATAFSESGVMMALEHTTLPIYGVQFHPESILSDFGMEMFKNFLDIAT